MNLLGLMFLLIKLFAVLCSFQLGHSIGATWLMVIHLYASLFSLSCSFFCLVEKFHTNTLGFLWTVGAGFVL